MRLHICYTRYSRVEAFRIKCPNCRPFQCAAVGAFQEWYGWYVTCLRCGERFADGEWMPRPAERGWRQDSIRSARRQYRDAHPRARKFATLPQEPGS
jgi:hypothetical protein